jgi:hypothetical protein
MSLLAWLVNLGIDPAHPDSDDRDDNIFYDRYIRLPVAELVKSNFVKHLEGDSRHKSSRDGSIDDAYALLAIINKDHRDLDGENEPIDIAEDLLDGDDDCSDQFSEWLQKTSAEHVCIHTCIMYESSKKIIYIFPSIIDV